MYSYYMCWTRTIGSTLQSQNGNRGTQVGCGHEFKALRAPRQMGDGEQSRASEWQASSRGAVEESSHGRISMVMRGNRSLSDICDNPDDDVVSALAAAFCDEDDEAGCERTVLHLREVDGEREMQRALDWKKED